MDVKVEWTIGFDENQLFYIDKDTLVYISGQVVCFHNEDNNKVVMPLPSYAARILAVHPSDNVFALAETDKLNPLIFIYQYPSLDLLATISNAGQLEIVKMSFSQSIYLAIVSGLPDYTLSIWNFKNQTFLCKKELQFHTVVDMSISPVNWRNIVIVNGSRVNLYIVENCGSLYKINDIYIKLPSSDTSIGSDLSARVLDSRTTITQGMSQMISYDFDLPPSSIAGVSNEHFKEFLESEDLVNRCVCDSHSWSSSGDLYFGCQLGQIVKLEIDDLKFKMIYNPEVNISKTIMRIGTPVINKTSFNLSNNAQHLCFSKEGLYLGGTDGVLRLLRQADNEISDKIEDIHNIKGSISKLCFNYNYTQLAVTSTSGIIDILSANENLEPPKTVANLNFGSFVGVGVLSKENFVVTLRHNGIVQIWDFETQELISELSLPDNTSCISVCPLWNIIAIGTTSGCLIIIDVNDINNMRVVHDILLHESPLSKLQFDNRGQIIVTGGDDGNIVIVSGLISENFRVLGMTTFEGTLIDLCIFNNPTSDDIAQVAVLSQTFPEIMGANKLIYFEISTSIFNNPSGFYFNISGIFDDEAITKMKLNFETPVFGCALGIQAPEERSPCFYAIDSVSRSLTKYQIPSQAPKKAGNKASYLKSLYTFNMLHDDPNALIRTSINNRFLITFGIEGVIRIIDLKNENSIGSAFVHQMNFNGVTDAALTFDNSNVISCSSDGTISCHKISLPQAVKTQNEQDYNNIISILDRKIAQENTHLKSLAGVDNGKRSSTNNVLNRSSTDQSIDTDDSVRNTWTEKRIIEHQVEEDQQYHDLKHNIKLGVKSIKDVIQEMFQENERLSDLEKIDRQEFELDIETKSKMKADVENEVQKVRDEIELENLSRQYMHDIIKKECWDQMSVKGRSLCSFLSNIEVTNFPMKDRDKKVLDDIEMVIKRRMIEIHDSHDRKKFTDNLQKSSMNADEGEEIDEDETKESKSFFAYDRSDYEKYEKITPNVKYLYPQMELETKEQKIYQIYLLKDIIFQIKVAFNKEFEDVYNKKEQEISRIKEKNARINKILIDIDMPHLIQLDPEFTNLEKPEKLLVVDDSEVKVEKYLTDEQKRKLEEDQLAEEERKRKEKLDNWRERGLEDMMGGVLEIKREDELKKDIPKPLFVIAGKSQEEWNDEEKKIFEEYERKVKELNEEREKYKKQLEAEYKKLATIIDDAKSAFDELLLNLFNRQINVQMLVYQEEVKILRLQWSLLIDEELSSRKKEIFELMELNHTDRENVKTDITDVKVLLEKSQEEYDDIVAEEKLMDKAFRKEFGDVHGPIFDYITKLYKRRPRNKLIGTLIIPSNQMPNYSKFNPYLVRPTSEKQKMYQFEMLRNAIQELNKQDASDSVEASLYERLCKSRQNRIEKEFKIKQKAHDLAEMHAFCQKRIEEEKLLENNEIHLQTLMETLEKQKYQFYLNKEIQLIMKQGQVEVVSTPGFIHDYTESVLLNRSLIEDLNKEIKILGTNKVKHMNKAKESKKKFIHLEWELRKMLMEYEDLVTKMKEIQCFKVTKEIQRYLTTNDYDGLINAEIIKMEQTINNLKQHQSKNIDQKKSRFRVISDKKLNKIKNENEDLSVQLTELNVEVNERKHINSGFLGDKISQVSMEKRYQKILQRQHLIDLAKSQAREVAVLRSEVERLRMRTFPALVQHK